MKKLITLCILSIFVVATKGNAQNNGTTQVNNGILNIVLKDGETEMTVPGIDGKITIIKREGKFVRGLYRSVLGRDAELNPVPPNTKGLPKPSCTNSLPDACFATADKTIGLCICKPGAISNGSNNVYTVNARLQMPIGKAGGGTPGH